MTTLAEPIISYLMSFEIQVGRAVSVDDRSPSRRFVPILGGTVSGRLSGTICEGGGDWQTVGADGTIELEAHYIADLAGHGPLEVRSTGVRCALPDGGSYFRTTMRFRTQATGLVWLNKRLCFSTGRREASAVHLDIYEVS